MSQITASELLNSASLEISYKGVTATRFFMVTMDVGTDPTSMLFLACGVSGIPQLYDPHPSITHLIVTKISPKPAGPKSPNQIIVEVLYEYDFDRSKNAPSLTGPCTVEYSTVMASVKTTRDAFGDPMILNFVDPAVADNVAVVLAQYEVALAEYNLNPVGNPPEFPNLQTNPRQQSAEIEIQVPLPVVTYRRREPLNGGRDYTALQLQYNGHINTRTFLKGAPHTWMMTALEATLQGDAYNVTYRFQYHGNLDPNSWDGLFFFKEPSGTRNLTQGSPALDISLDNGGIAIIQVIPDADFNQLGLYS